MIQLLRWLMVLVLAVLAGKLISKIKLSSILGWLVFCQVLFPEKSVEIPCFRQGIFPTFGGH